MGENPDGLADARGNSETALGGCASAIGRVDGATAAPEARRSVTTCLLRTSGSRSPPNGRKKSCEGSWASSR
jgi:hypothetical protein